MNTTTNQSAASMSSPAYQAYWILHVQIFAYVVAAWLVVIIINLLLIPGYFDIALRDFGLFLAALALARLSQQYARA